MIRIITQLVVKMEKKMTSNIGNNIEAYAEAARKHRPEAVCLGQIGRLGFNFLHANMLDVMGRQPLHEHFLFLREFDDRALLSIQRGDEFKDAISTPLGAVLSVNPVVVGL